MAELIVSSDGETLEGTAENDLLEAVGFSETTLNGLDGDDELIAGTDGTLNGGAGNDLLDGTAGGGGNTLNGEAGDDTLLGNSNDILNGGEGADRLFTTGAGGNTYTGDAGADQFWLAQADIPTTANTVTDFTQGEDVLGIGGLDGIVDSFEDLDIATAEGNTTITIPGQENPSAILEGFTDGLTADDFAIVTEEEPDVTPVVEDATFEVEEESPVGTEVGTVTVTDAQGGDLTLALSGDLDVDGDGTEAFAIDDTGLITVADSDDIDYEVQRSFDFEVTAEDPEGNIGRGNVTVDLINNPDDDPELQADFTGDGLVNLNDLGIFAAAFGSSEGDDNFNEIADLTGDGLVNLNDLGIFAAEFGASA